MNKVIPIEQLEIGMCISNVGNDWIPAASKKRSGYIRNQATLEKIKALGIFEVTIIESEEKTAENNVSAAEKNNNDTSSKSNDTSTENSKAALRARLEAERERLLSIKKKIQKKKNIQKQLASKKESLKLDSIKKVENPKGLLDQVAEQKLVNIEPDKPSQQAPAESKGLIDKIAEQKSTTADSEIPSESDKAKSQGLLDKIAEQKPATDEAVDASNENSNNKSPSESGGLLDKIAKEKQHSKPGTAANISQNPSTEGLAQKAKKYIPGSIVVPFEEEFEKAQELHGKVKTLVKESMGQAKIGKPIDIDGIEDLADGLIDSIISNRNTLSMMSVIKNQDNYLHEHSVNCGILMGIFSRQLKLPLETIHDLVTGAILHDIGMSKIDDAILSKPGPLSPAEATEMQRHVIYGRRLLEKSRGIPAMALEVCKQHHERLDGQGYPQRMHSHQVNQFGRIAAIVDVYDALTSDRAYRKAFPPAAAMKKLLELSGSHLDGKLVYQFIQSINIYPVGSLVELDDSRVGVVHELNTFKKDQPKVRVFYNGQSECNIPPETIDLSHPDIKTKIKKATDISNFNIDLKDVI